jgi:hypothetical protein
LVPINDFATTKEADRPLQMSLNIGQIQNGHFSVYFELFASTAMHLKI